MPFAHGRNGRDSGYHAEVGRDQPGSPIHRYSSVHPLTEDLEGSLAYMKKLGVELVTEIEHNQWFVVKDPDGNKLMICRE